MKEAQEIEDEVPGPDDSSKFQENGAARFHAKMIGTTSCCYRRRLVVQVDDNKYHNIV